MNAPRIASLVAALVLVAPFPLLAQQESLLAPGERVRVTAPGIGVHERVCTFSALRRDTALVMERGGTLLALPLASITKLEVSRGRRSRVGKGAVIGLLAGAGAGVLLGALDLAQEEGGAEYVLLGWAGLGAGAGALFGAVLGAVIRVDRWEPVRLYPVRVGLGSQRNGALTLSLSFSH
jgi:hypothetical protein